MNGETNCCTGRKLQVGSSKEGKGYAVDAVYESSACACCRTLLGREWMCTVGHFFSALVGVESGYYSRLAHGSCQTQASGRDAGKCGERAHGIVGMESFLRYCVGTFALQWGPYGYFLSPWLLHRVLTRYLHCPVVVTNDISMTQQGDF